MTYSATASRATRGAAPLRTGLKSSAAMPSDFSQPRIRLLRWWFAKESAEMTGSNAMASLALLSWAAQMTLWGLKIALWAGIAAPPLLAPMLVAGLGALTLLRGVFMLVTNKKGNGLIGALLTISGALTLGLGSFGLALDFYKSSIPAFMRGAALDADDYMTQAFRFVSRTILPYVRPVVTASLGALLGAKQWKTSGVIKEQITSMQNSDARAGLLGWLKFQGLRLGKLFADSGWISGFAATGLGIWAGLDIQHAVIGPTGHDLVTYGDTTYPAPAHGINGVATMYQEGSECRITSPQNLHRIDPITHHLGSHPGIDTAAVQGEQPMVHSPISGTVVEAEREGGYGNRIGVQADPRSAYNDDPRYPVVLSAGHLQDIYVKSGQHVEAGDIIGREGSTGHSDGDHVHWELHDCKLGGGECGPAKLVNEFYPMIVNFHRLRCQGAVM